MQNIPLIIFIGLPAFFLMFLKHPRLQKKLISFILWIDKHGDVSKCLSFIAIGLTLGVTTEDYIFVNLLSGHLYGVWKGTILSSFIYGLSLIIGQFIGSDTAVRIVNKIETMDDVIQDLFKVKDTLTNQEMFELVVLSRLSPIIPDSFITMMWGTTGIDTSILFSASILGNIPNCIIYTYLGSLVPHPKHLFSHTYNISDRYEYLILFSLAGVSITYGSHELARYLITHHRAVR